MAPCILQRVGSRNRAHGGRRIVTIVARIQVGVEKDSLIILKEVSVYRLVGHVMKSHWQGWLLNEYRKNINPACCTSTGPFYL